MSNIEVPNLTIGSVVVLRQQKKAMTVTDLSDTTATCTWFDKEEQIKVWVFPLAALVRIDL